MVFHNDFLRPNKKITPNNEQTEKSDICRSGFCRFLILFLSDKKVSFVKAVWSGSKEKKQ